MSTLAVILLLFMLTRGQGGGGGLFPTVPKPKELPYSPDPSLGPAAKPSAAPPAAQAAKITPAPWPQAVPAGLPPFGPAGWQPDDPPPQAVQARAWQLLSQLWKYGAGTKKVEQTAGRWITYVATPMGKKKGVVAYRVRPEAMTQAPPSPASDAAPLNV